MSSLQKRMTGIASRVAASSDSLQSRLKKKVSPTKVKKVANQFYKFLKKNEGEWFVLADLLGEIDDYPASDTSGVKAIKLLLDDGRITSMTKGTQPVYSFAIYP